MANIPETQRKLTHAAAELRLMDIFLKKMEVSTAEDFVPLLAPEHVVFQFRFKSTRHSVQTLTPKEDPAGVEIKLVAFDVEAGARFMEPSATAAGGAEEVEASETIGEISAVFSALYALNNCEDDCLRTFGVHNVPLHVWPYFRELLQSTMPRFRLPSVALGMYVPGKGAHSPASADILLPHL